MDKSEFIRINSDRQGIMRIYPNILIYSIGGYTDISGFIRIKPV